MTKYLQAISLILAIYGAGCAAGDTSTRGSEIGGDGYGGDGYGGDGYGGGGCDLSCPGHPETTCPEGTDSCRALDLNTTLECTASDGTVSEVGCP